MTQEEQQHFAGILYEKFQHDLQLLAESMQAQFARTHREMDEFREETRLEFAMIKSVLTKHSGDIGELKQDVAVLKQDVAVLKQDVAEIKRDLRGIHHKLDDHDMAIAELRA